MAHFLYDKVSQDIMAMLADQEYSVGDKLPTLTELAAHFGVSLITTRKAIDALKDEGYLRSRRGSGVYVERLPHSGQYLGRKSIAVVVPQFDGTSGQKTILAGLRTRLERAGHQLLFVDTSTSLHDERNVLIQIGESNPAGLVYYPLDFNSVADYLMVLQARDIPIVIIDKESTDLNLPCVSSDNRDGARQAVRHLLENGHTQIAFVAMHGFEAVAAIRTRFLGYCNALAEAKCTIDYRYIHTRISSGSDEADPATATALLQHLKSLGVTAIFASSDYVAIFLYCQMKALGWRIPEDMSLVGFDNVDTCELLECPLTTVAQDFHAIGVRAFKMITDLLAGKKLFQSKQHLPVKLIKRQSVLDLTKPGD